MISMGLKPPTHNITLLQKYGADEMREMGCDTMAHVIFWRKIMNLHQDSCLINVHSCRKVLTTYPAINWNMCSVNQRLSIADSLRKLSGIYDSSRVVGTMGKRFFYSFEKVYENEETSNRVTTNSSIQDELDSSSSKELKSSIFTEQQNLVNQTTQTKKRVALLIPDNEA